MAKAKAVTNLDPHAPTGKMARMIARTRLDEMYEWDIYVDDSYNIHELHNMRIAAKRLRYTLEIFEDTFSPEVGQIIEQVTQIQEELGAIHDSDVMVALLRLCLGSHDSGAGYEDMLRDSAPGQQGKAMVNPFMLAFLLDPYSPPSAEERAGLEFLLNNLHQQREEQYASFRQHWYQLKERDFRREILALLDN